MKLSKQKFLNHALPVLIFFGFALSAYAVTIPNPLPGTFLDNFNRLTSLIRPAAILFFLAMFLYGGFEIGGSGADSGQMVKGWKTILGAIIGLSIITMGPSAVNLVGSMLGTKTLIDF